METSVKHQPSRLGWKARRGLSTTEAPKQTRVALGSRSEARHTHVLLWRHPNRPGVPLGNRALRLDTLMCSLPVPAPSYNRQLININEPQLPI